MKYLFTLFISSFFLNSNSQTVTDSIFLKNGDVYSGKLIEETQFYYLFLVQGSNSNSKVFKNEIKSISLISDKEYKIGKNVYVPFEVTNEDVQITKDVTKDNQLENLIRMRKQLNSGSRHFKTAGNFGITAGIFMVGGSILSIVGLVTDNPNLSYVGAGVGGLGLVLTIPAFVFIKKGGKVLVK
jgi:hypothetical protein